jgi:hypothetical protein
MGNHPQLDSEEEIKFYNDDLLASADPSQWVSYDGAAWSGAPCYAQECYKFYSVGKSHTCFSIFTEFQAPVQSYKTFTECSK